MRVRLTISYDGTNYSGWQIQPNCDTIQETVQRAVREVTGEEVTVTGSGRTDAGVHARMQTAHFDTDSTIPASQFFKALNTKLPKDIRVLKSERVDDDFHAVKSAKKKTYLYSIYLGETEDPLTDRYATRFSEESMDLRRIKKACKVFKGEHDFKGFSATGGSAKTSVRKIYDFKVKRKGQRLYFYVCGNGFLYKMVRMLVGACVMCGYKKITIKDIKEALTSGTKMKIQQTLPAKGLCLYSVKYQEK